MKFAIKRGIDCENVIGRLNISDEKLTKSRL